MEDLRSIFKEKNFNERTLQIIGRFIEKFDKYFGKYLSKEEVIKRIKENLDKNILFVDKIDEKGATAKYNSENRSISILNSILDEKKIASIIFHELIHCITTNQKKRTCGFKEIYEDTLGNKVAVGKGMNEGMTQMLTNIRNMGEGYLEITAYPILMQQMQNLAKVIGKENLIDIFLNDPDKLEEIMGDDLHEFKRSLDVIWKNENKLFNKKTKEDRLVKAIFGTSVEDDKSVKEAKGYITETLTRIILNKEGNSVSDYEKKLNFITRQIKDFNVKQYEYSIGMILEGINNFRMQNNISEEEALSQIGDIKNRRLMEEYLEFVKVKESNLSEREILEILSENKSGFLKGTMKRKYISTLLQDVFGKPINQNMQEILVRVLPVILENNWNIKRIGFEFFPTDSISVLDVISISNYLDGRKEPIGTYNINGKTIERLEETLPSEEQLEILKRLDKDISKENKIMVTQKGEILLKKGEKLIFIYGMNEKEKKAVLEGSEDIVYEVTEIEEEPSTLEYLEGKLKLRQDTYDECIEAGFPKLIEKQKKLISDTENEIRKIKEKEQEVEKVEQSGPGERD